jgi:hypothetical protein
MKVQLMVEKILLNVVVFKYGKVQQIIFYK